MLNVQANSSRWRGKRGRAAGRAMMAAFAAPRAHTLSLTNQTVAAADLGDVGRRLLKRRIGVILGRDRPAAERL